MKKPADKRFANVLTIEQLTELCKTLTGKSLKESLAIGKKAIATTTYTTCATAEE